MKLQLSKNYSIGSFHWNINEFLIRFHPSPFIFHSLIIKGKEVNGSHVSRLQVLKIYNALQTSHLFQRKSRGLGNDFIIHP